MQRIIWRLIPTNYSEIVSTYTCNTATYSRDIAEGRLTINYYIVIVMTRNVNAHEISL